MAKVDYDEDDLSTDIDINEGINKVRDSGHSALEIRRKIEEILEEKRLRKELDDFYDD